MGPHLFVCTVWRERRACPLEELKGCPQWMWAFCWYWERFSGGVLIHILNMQSYNKAKGTDNTPRTREDIVKPRPSHKQGSPLHTLCGQNKTRLCWRSYVTTAIHYHSKKPLWLSISSENRVFVCFHPHHYNWSLPYLHREWKHLCGSSDTLKSIRLTVRLSVAHKSLVTTMRYFFVEIFVVLFSTLFNTVHLQHPLKTAQELAKCFLVSFVFWNCCILIHILSVGLLLSMHITHLGG